jgi:FkbM family methyltransferase
MNKYFGRHNQDKIILDILANKRDGIFIDIGATDGITSNNTYKMELDMGWFGVCIEPNTDFFVQLRKNRKCSCLNACVGAKAQTGIVKFKEDMGNGELSKISSSEFNCFKPCFDMDVILRWIGVPQIDFLSIDAEGSELDIISGIDFDKYRIRTICYEHNDRYGEPHTSQKKKIEDILMLKYEKHMDIDTDSIFILKDG